MLYLADVPAACPASRTRRSETVYNLKGALMRKLYGTVTIVLAMWTAMATLSSGAQPAPESDDKALSLDAAMAISKLSEEIFPLADSDRWDTLSDKLAQLNQATDVLDTEAVHDKEGKLLLSKSITDLEEAAAARDALGAMQAANQITLIVADATDRFKLKVPSDVARLAYYSRELRIGAEEKEARQLQLSAKSLQTTWSRLRTEVVKRPGGAEVAKRLDALVQQVQSAQSPDQYAAAVTALLDEVDSLKKLFAK